MAAPLHLMAPAAAAAAAPGPGPQQQSEEPAAAASSAAGAAAAGGVPPSALLEEVKLSDLELVVSNRPTYLYCHQGCCEHGWFVIDIRARHPTDPSPGGGAYPRTLFQAPPSARWRCGVCGTGRAASVVRGHPAAPEDPCLLCPGCSELLLPPGEGAGGASSQYKVYSLV